MSREKGNNALNDTDSGADAERQVEQLCKNWWTRLIGYIKRKVKERRAKKQEETAQDNVAGHNSTPNFCSASF